MSSREDIKFLLAKCEELCVKSAQIREYIEAQDAMRKIIYETNRTLINTMNGDRPETGSLKLTDVQVASELQQCSIVDNPNTDT